MDKISNIAGLVVITAMVGVIVGSPNTRGQIKALTDGFADVLTAATGRRK